MFDGTECNDQKTKMIKFYSIWNPIAEAIIPESIFMEIIAVLASRATDWNRPKNYTLIWYE